MFVTSVIMGVQTCLTYQIKEDILVYLNIIVYTFLSQKKLIIFLMKVKNDLLNIFSVSDSKFFEKKIKMLTLKFA